MNFCHPLRNEYRMEHNILSTENTKSFRCEFQHTSFCIKCSSMFSMCRIISQHPHEHEVQKSVCFIKPFQCLVTFNIIHRAAKKTNILPLFSRVYIGIIKVCIIMLKWRNIKYARKEIALVVGCWQLLRFLFEMMSKIYLVVILSECRLYAWLKRRDTQFIVYWQYEWANGLSKR